MKRKVLCMVLAMVMLVASLLAGCAPAEKEPIKIGFIGDLTSFLSLLGTTGMEGAILAMEEAGYEVAGRPVELIIEDDASDPALALDKARKLVETDKVSMILGPVNAACVDAVQPYLSGIPIPEIIYFTSASDEVLLNYEWIWAHTGTMPQLAYATGAYAAEVLGYKTATAMALDYVAGHDLNRGFKDGFEARGGKFIQQQWVAMETMDFAPYIVALEEADVFVPWLASGIIPGCKQFVDFGVKMPIMTPFSMELDDPEIMKAIGDYGIGAISTDVYCWNLDNPINNKFVPAYQNRWGRMPGGVSNGAYTAVQIALGALQRTKGDTSPQAIAKALDETDFEGATGRIHFGDRRVGVYTYVVYECIKVGDEYIPENLAYYTVEGKQVGDKLVPNVVNREILK